MSDAKRTEIKTIRFTPEEISQLEEEALAMGFRASRGKKSVKVATYIREKAISVQEKLVKIDQVEDIIKGYDDLRNISNQVSYFYHLTKTINSDIRASSALQEKYGDIPYLQEEHLDHVKSLCLDVIKKEEAIFDELVKINKQLKELKDQHGMLH